MPPDWIKTVNSACLMDSFSVVDKAKWEKSKSSIAKSCQACAKKTEKSNGIGNSQEGSSKRMAAIFDRIVKEHPRGEELVKILLFCKYLASQRNSDRDPSFCSELLSSSWSQLMSSTSPYVMHLLHFTREELAELCKPRDGLLVRKLKEINYFS